jgi:transcriptional regulator GlxA family with amidase domain
MRTKARSVAVVAFEEVDLLDLAAPLEVLSAAGRRWNFRPYKIAVLSARAGLVATREQLRVEASAALANAEPVEVLIVPGGYGARRASEDPEYQRELQRLGANAELVAGVGFGVVVLARAGLLADAQVAVAPEVEPELALHLDPRQHERHQPLVSSGRVITARSSGHALALSLSIVRRTMGPKLVGMVSLDLGIETDETPAKLEIRY